MAVEPGAEGANKRNPVSIAVDFISRKLREVGVHNVAA